MSENSVFRPVLRRWPVLLILILLWPVAAWGAAQALLPGRQECAASANALVVMAGARSYPERTRLAAGLFARGAAPRIVLTHDGVQGSYLHSQERNPWMVERSAWELQKHGVPISVIEVLPERVSSTRDEAELLARYSAERGWGSLLVVTSGYHARRTRWTFEQRFADGDTRVYLCGTSPGGTRLSPATWWLFPSGWDAVAGEYVRWVGYRILF